jgi:hypothetical protein
MFLKSFPRISLRFILVYSIYAYSLLAISRTLSGEDAEEDNDKPAFSCSSSKIGVLKALEINYSTENYSSSCMISMSSLKSSYQCYCYIGLITEALSAKRFLHKLA